MKYIDVSWLLWNTITNSKITTNLHLTMTAKSIIWNVCSVRKQRRKENIPIRTHPISILFLLFDSIFSFFLLFFKYFLKLAVNFSGNTTDTFCRVHLLIEFKYVKIRTRKTPYLEIISWRNCTQTWQKCVVDHATGG